MNKWDFRFMKLANEIASWSKDPSSKIGAVAVDENRRILGTGYNGFPVNDKDDLIEYYIREVKYEKIIHAEKNLILNCLNSGVSLKGASIYVWGLPVCKDCAKELTQTGINRVFAAWDSKNKSATKWEKELSKTIDFFNSAEIDFFDISNEFTWSSDRLDVVAVEKIDSGLNFILRCGLKIRIDDEYSNFEEKLKSINEMIRTKSWD